MRATVLLLLGAMPPLPRASAEWGPKPRTLAARDDAPSTSDFLRRPMAVAIVIGDYLYIDGGEVAQLYNGQNSTGGLPSYAVNTTLSLPLASSWTNATVVFTATPKPAPLLNSQAAWRAPSGNAFYVWGGVTPWFATPPPSSEIWKFTADGRGRGSWEREPPRDVVGMARNVRATDGAWTHGGGVGYWVGGVASAQTDTSVTGETRLAMTGVVAFDMTSGEVGNSSTEGMGRFGTLVGGGVQWTPFGNGGEGVLVFLGGRESPVEAPGEGTGVGFGRVAVYEPKGQKWFYQATTGTRPTPREKFCVVGVQGPNGTYEIFMYGGLLVAGGASDEVYVLSLPGFVFFKAPPGPSTKRSSNSCVVVGKRQLLSVGGGDGSLGFPDSLLDPDPWKNGLGVFDMTRMAWSDGYDADAAAYESPAIVREWYSQGGLESVTWSSPEVERLFAAVSTPAPGDPDSPPPSGSGLGSPSPGSPSTPVGAIVGGVVAGVGGLALVGLAFWLFFRRRAQGVSSPAELAPGEVKDAEKWEEPGFGIAPQELEANFAASELPARHGLSEVGTSESHGRTELPGSTANWKQSAP
ncbi:kelch repeat-containing protein [Podospora conica]|nr:kelch repeat-containing protein [Schizothecium conicum]